MWEAGWNMILSDFSAGNFMGALGAYVGLMYGATSNWLLTGINLALFGSPLWLPIYFLYHHIQKRRQGKKE